MAKISYLREGTGPQRVILGFDIARDKLMAQMGSRTAQYVGHEPPSSPTDREDLTPVRDSRWVLAYISAGEINQIFPKEGFYLLNDVEPKEACDWDSL